VRLSTMPRSTALSRWPTWALVHGVSSTRVASLSFHRAATTSGGWAPVRTVRTTVARRVRTSLCTSVADRSSSRWASSIPTTTGPPWARRASRTAAMACHAAVGSEDAPATGTRWASAPSGIAAVPRVQVTHSVRRPRARRVLMASWASRVRPTPCPPETITAVGLRPPPMSRTARSLAPRSTNDQSEPFPPTGCTGRSSGSPISSPRTTSATAPRWGPAGTSGGPRRPALM
jgi:hypothetical protein